MGKPLVIGVDAGATTTRCVVSDLDGTIVARGTAGGANQNSSGTALAADQTSARAPFGADQTSVRASFGADQTSARAPFGADRMPSGVPFGADRNFSGVTRVPFGADRNSGGAAPGEALTAALREAVAGLDPARVALGVIGVAGAGAAGRDAARAAVLDAWRAADLPGRVVTVTDLEVAFAAGTPAPDGLLLLAGTGAVSAAFAGSRLSRRCDGFGWLAGDEGSAVWLGREALRAVLRALDGRGPQTALVAAVSRVLGTAAAEESVLTDTPMLGGVAASGPVLSAADDPDERAQALLRIVYGRPPAALGRLAPVVNDLAARGDPVALALAREAAGHLLHALHTVARGGVPGGGPVVVAGSVLLSPGLVRDLVCAGIQERFGMAPIEARDGAAGAAWLALGELDAPADRRATHARLTATPR
ncbi:N-acetylglucosamine kinase [Dactylosporangium sp. CA-092794]|uniref:N-acetylglucosamine kinase n=1 Tax=Dactylosporangium sp. CA-092794 TaxID=3239929 RepID=UPI003D8EB64D